MMNNESEKKTQSQLQFQMDINKDLACVVFDEIHYINDVDRGRVWEQTILMLPPHIQMIMLSATIDAPEKFAKWCEKPESGKQVYLSSTHTRIVPLVHYGYLPLWCWCVFGHDSRHGIFKLLKTNRYSCTKLYFK